MHEGGGGAEGGVVVRKRDGGGMGCEVIDSQEAVMFWGSGWPSGRRRARRVKCTRCGISDEVGFLAWEPLGGGRWVGQRTDRLICPNLGPRIRRPVLHCVLLRPLRCGGAGEEMWVNMGVNSFEKL